MGVMLRFVPLPRLLRILHRFRFTPLFPQNLASEQVVSLADLATRLTHGQGRCLPRSLLLCWLLGSRGESVDLLVGVRQNGSKLSSHAWVEANGGVLGERPCALDHFGTILRLSA